MTNSSVAQSLKFKKRDFSLRSKWQNQPCHTEALAEVSINLKCEFALLKRILNSVDISLRSIWQQWCGFSLFNASSKWQQKAFKVLFKLLNLRLKSHKKQSFKTLSTRVSTSEIWFAFANLSLGLNCLLRFVFVAKIAFLRLATPFCENSSQGQNA